MQQRGEDKMGEEAGGVTSGRYQGDPPPRSWLARLLDIHNEILPLSPPTSSVS